MKDNGLDLGTLLDRLAILEKENTALRAEVVQLRDEKREWVDAVVQGEAVRERVMLDLLVMGDFTAQPLSSSGSDDLHREGKD